MYRILLADDEQIERMALANRLKKRFGDSIEICEAINGLEAVEVFKREKSQIVIMDIAMPELNGVEAAEQIRRLDEDCVIIFLTAYDEFSYARRAIIIRALDYLLKPCEEEELAAVLEEAMRLTHKRRENKDSQPAGEYQRAIQENGWPAEVESFWEKEARGKEDAPSESSHMNQVAETIRSYIRENYMKEISMQDAARMMNYSDAYFCKLFKQ